MHTTLTDWEKSRNIIRNQQVHDRTTSHPVISVALVGCRQASEVEENLGALGWAISEADMAAIDTIFARHNAVTMPAGWLEDA